MVKGNSLSGMSWILGTLNKAGEFGVMQVFDIAQHGQTSDSDYWESASARAKEAARKSLSGWQHHFVRTRPNETLVIRLMKGDRCTAVINKADAVPSDA